MVQRGKILSCELIPDNLDGRLIGDTLLYKYEGDVILPADPVTGVTVNDHTFPNDQRVAPPLGEEALCQEGKLRLIERRHDVGEFLDDVHFIDLLFSYGHLYVLSYTSCYVHGVRRKRKPEVTGPRVFCYYLLSKGLKG